MAKKIDSNGYIYPMTKAQHRRLCFKATCAEELPDWKHDGSPYTFNRVARWNNSKAQREVQNRPEVVARSRETALRQHRRPGYKEQHIRKMQSPEVVARLKESAQKVPPEVVARRIEACRSPEARKKRRRSMLEVVKRPGFLEARGAAIRRGKRSPAGKARTKAAAKQRAKGQSFEGRCRSFLEAWIYYYLHPRGAPGGKLGFASSNQRLVERGRAYRREGWGRKIRKGLHWMDRDEFTGFDLAIKIRADEGAGSVPYDIEQDVLDMHERPINEVLTKNNSIKQIEKLILKLCKKRGLQVVAVTRRKRAGTGHAATPPPL